MNKMILIILICLPFNFSCKKHIDGLGEKISDLPDCKCFVQTSTDSYIYPIRPGSEEWKALKTSEEMVKVTQMPQDVINNMSTIGLFESVVENPLFVELSLSSTPKYFYDYHKTTSEAMIELLSRENVGSTLISRYAEMCWSCKENNYSYYNGKGGNIIGSYASIELLLAQEDIFSKASRNEHKILGQVLISNHEENDIDRQNSNFCFDAWIAANLMDYYNYRGFNNLLENNDSVKLFLGSGYISSDSSLYDQIFKQFKLFIKDEL